MVKVRAYKLAEELGIDRGEFVERAAAEGIELKSSMAALEPEQVDLLRSKLGKTTVDRSAMDEHRVQSKSGSTIVRRRRKKVVAPEPEPEAPVAPVNVVAAVAEEVAAPGVAAAADTVTEGAPAEEAVAAAQEPAVAQPAAQAQQPAGATAAAPARKRPGAEEPPDRKGKARKRVREVVNLREQEQVKLQYAGRGGLRRRAPIVNPRSVVNPRSKRRDKLNKASPLACRPLVPLRVSGVSAWSFVDRGGPARAVAIG